MATYIFKLQPILRTFDSRNLRLFFIGQGISVIGTWMTNIATVWLVYHLTNSPLWLGLVGFSGQIPSFLLSPMGGILADRVNRHHIIVITQVLSMLQSLALAVLALTGTIQIWQIICLSIFQGVVSAFDIPARQSFLTQMVEKKEYLGNAIALNSSMFNGARLIGPAIGGVLIAAVGTGMCFLIDGISYIAVIIALLMMNIKPSKITITNTNPWEKLKEGFVYAFSFPPIRSILMLLAFVSFVGMPYTTLIPIFAKDILHGGADTLGFLMSASGIGALIGGIYLSLRPSVLGLVKIITFAPAILGTGLIIFSLSQTFWLSELVLLLVGFGSIMQIASSNTVLQTLVDEDKRGRLMSLFTMSFMGMMPIGSLFFGSLANHIGAPNTLRIGGLFCLLGSFLFYQQLPQLRHFIRPVYTKLGLYEQ